MAVSVMKTVLEIAELFSKSRKPKLVLVVDDQRDYIFVLKELFRQCGLDSPMSTDRVAEAIQLVKDNKFALVIIDYDLGDQPNGVECALIMCELDSKIQCVIHSQHEHALQLAYDKGFPIWPKPMQAETLRRFCS